MVFLPLLAIILTFLGIGFGEVLKKIVGWLIGIDVETPLFDVIKASGVISATWLFFKANWLLFIVNAIVLFVGFLILAILLAKTVEPPIYRDDLIGQIRYRQYIELGSDIANFIVLSHMFLSIGY